ncbi:RNA exonuclease 4 [Scheffersomyces amazonensis]|uniref:RNA exonuclease 4 n=1 Tax=Scheffersomyces amazonensis TaxID=1078765 RepID=UPI00315D31A2
MALSENWKKLSLRVEKNGKGKGQGKDAGKGKVVKVRKFKKVVKVDEHNHNHKVIEKVNVIPTKSTIESILATDKEITSQDLLNAKESESHKLIPKGSDSRKIEPGKYLSMDCEFVGVGPEGAESALARVSIVNFYGHVILDEFVKPREKVTDWRTWVSGVTPKHMHNAITFTEAQQKTSDLLKGRILVGHAIHHDLDALFLSHPKVMIRDTTQYVPFRKIASGRTPSLKKLTSHFLQIDIQGAAHSSVEDARATMLLFRLHKRDFERQLRQKSKV